MTMEWSVAVSVMCALVGAVTGITAGLRSARTDRESQARQMGQISTQISHVQQGIAEIQVRLKETEERYLGVATRLCAVEENVRQTDKWVDQAVQRVPSGLRCRD